MKGYKGMKSDMTCRGMKFEIGKTYRVDGKIKICSKGLHFCQNLKDVFNYYNDVNDRYFEVETDSEVFTENDKLVTSELKIIREIKSIELNRIKYGDGYGYGYNNGYGYGYNNGNGDGDGYNNGCGYNKGNGYGYGNGDGYGYGNGYDANIQIVLEFNN